MLCTRGKKTLRAEYTSSKFNPHKASSRICGRRLLSLLRQSNSLSSDYSLPSGLTNTHFLKVVIYNGLVFTDYPRSAWTGVMRRLKCRGRVLANKEFNRCQRSICSDFLETNDNLWKKKTKQKLIEIIVKGIFIGKANIYHADTDIAQV